MDQKDLISVIVPVYKTEQYLERCVKSIVSQTYRDIEVILVDDGSPDGSGKLADMLASADERIRVVHKENGGLSSARNAGLDIAIGEYVSFVDSDDFISQTMLENMHRLMKSTGADVVATGRIDKYEDSGKETENFKSEQEVCYTSEQAIVRLLTRDGLDVSVCDKLFARTLFDKIRFPVGKTNEDNAIIFDVFMQVKRLARTNTADYYYCHRSNSISTSISERAMQCLLENVRRNAELISTHFPMLETQARIYAGTSNMLVYREISRKKMNHSEPSAREMEMFHDAKAFLMQNYKVLIKQKSLGKMFLMELRFVKLGVYGSVMRMYHWIKRK